MIVGVDSYISLEDAQAYFANRLRSDAWDEASELEKEKALKTATKRINCLRFIGRPVDPNQELAFPRLIQNSFGVLVRVDIPKAVKEATCEEAISLLEQGDHDIKRRKLQDAGVVSVTAGDASETYSNIKRDRPLASPDAARLLAPFLLRGAWIV